MLHSSTALGKQFADLRLNITPTFRVWKLNLLLLISFLYLQLPAHAQQQPVLTDSLYLNSISYSDSLRDIPNVASSTKITPFLRTATIATVGAGTWIATFALVDEPLQQYAQSHRNAFSDNIASVVQPLGRAKHLVPVSGLVFAGGLLFKDSKLEKLGIISMGSLLTNSFVTSKLKNTFLRYRPSATTENHIFEGDTRVYDNSSLPSSHTSTAFAMATSVALVYKDTWVPPVAYGVATLVGLSRINDNAHWATDVMAGALVGYITARGVNHLYEVASQKYKIHKQRIHLVPQFAMRSGGINAVLVF